MTKQESFVTKQEKIAANQERNVIKNKRTASFFSISLMTIRKWHWMSAALCFICLLLFSVTGITLHHSKIFLPRLIVTHVEREVPKDLLSLIDIKGEQKNIAVSAGIYEWFSRKDIALDSKKTEIKESKFFIPLGHPGIAANVSINLTTGHYDYEVSDKGWLGYLNDLHKGKNTGDAWVYFIDIFAIACIIFLITGFLLLQRYANTRAKIWPLLIAGLVMPIFFMMFLIY